MVKVLEGSTVDELPLIVAKMGRNDTIEMRDAILNITPGERKKLGINKSTLGYLQKNLREGKRIKIYDKVIDKMAKTD